MTEYVCVTLQSKPRESEAAFKARLASFWTHMLRAHPDDYEKVYAEATAFETAGGVVSRQYMVEVDGTAALTRELGGQGVDFLPIDEDDTYSKYEATSPDWFQIEH
ncbi:hypothetical protein [Fimbriiglobus ruber]|uniref:Uncharacterized protein n=1 Tax=Fimbriiglobus ruber TaxID=1908690 RepID=A0A225E4K1_9BACT|nr:hypothetical protein [Fimbriiglobus ruber]OWK45006.1 hypothetical protein FRUB_01337 [Fimbriiglobus ruber]